MVDDRKIGRIFSQARRPGRNGDTLIVSFSSRADAKWHSTSIKSVGKYCLSALYLQAVYFVLFVSLLLGLNTVQSCAGFGGKSETDIQEVSIINGRFCVSRKPIEQYTPYNCYNSDSCRCNSVYIRNLQYFSARPFKSRASLARSNMAATDKQTPRSARLQSKNDSSDKSQCVFCDEMLDGKKPAAKCDKCDNWVCLSCSKLSKTMYAELSKSDTDIEWSCKVCRTLKSDLKSISVNIAELRVSNETRLTNVENRLSGLENSVAETVRKEVDSAKDDIKRSVHEGIAETVDEIVEKKLKEMDDRKNRSQNVIIFNLKTSESSDPHVRKEHDIALVNKLFTALCPDKGDIDLKACYRMRNKDKPLDKKVPLKLVLQSKLQRRFLLSNSGKASSLEDEDLKPVVIVRDLTVEQRKQGKKTRSELTRRRDEGENVEARFGEVTPINPDREAFR